MSFDPDRIVPAEAARYEDELAFPASEYQRRLHVLHENMDAAGVDVLLVTTCINIHYLTGYQNSGQDRFQCLIVPRNGEPHFVLRKLWFTAVLGLSWTKAGTPVEDTDDMHAATLDALKRIAGSTASIGYDHQNLGMPPAFYDRLRATFSNARLVPSFGLVEKCRLYKSEPELQAIRSAAKLSVLGFEAAFNEMTPGKTESDVMAASYNTMVRAGSDYVSAQPIVVAGYRDPPRRCLTEGRTLREGTSVWYEGSAFVRRYGAPIMRTTAIGKPSADLAKISAVMVSALNAILDTAGPGVTAGAVDRAARAVVEKAGLGRFWLHRTGYSMGASFSPTWGEGEIMDIKAGDTRVLEPNTVFHTVPWVLVPGLGCIGNSETWMVTHDGVEVLTITPRELRIRD
ncbi:MAG TPA: Xaa-Pro peptidase family protein [Burkholderiales bacterium]|nr:Xaa-Pro peptidase family protein [Burkholderiales bacterium]